MAILLQSASSQYLAGFSDTPPTNVTMCFWIKPTAIGALQEIWNYTVKYQVSLLSTGYIENKIWDTKGFSSTSALTAGLWYHVVCTRDSGGNAATFINGVAAGTNTGHDNSPGTSSFVIGAYNYGNCALEDFRTYSRVLSLNEIQTLYACCGADGIQDDLTYWWIFNDGPLGTTVSTVYGQRGIGNLTANGSPVYTEGIVKWRRAYN